MKHLLSVWVLVISVSMLKAQAPIVQRESSAVTFESDVAVQLPYVAPSLAVLQRQDEARAQSDSRIRTGVFLEVSMDLLAQQSTAGAASQRYYSYLTRHSAKAIALYFRDLQIPVGDTLWIQGGEHVQVVTATHSAAVFATVLWTSDTIRLTYQQRKQHGEEAHVELSDVHYVYRTASQRDFGDSDFCQVNVACTEGDNWGDAADAVVRILVRDGNDSYWCSGAMINNVREDCTPYLLTAEHCSVSPTPNELSQWIFYFKYQSNDCNNPAQEGMLGNNYLTGASVVAQSNDNGGDFGSDFMLLELTSPLQPHFEVYLAGWDVQNQPPQSGVGIHHPNGDIKKISTYQQSANTTSFGGVAPNTHWGVTWAATANGHGVTESGSSGSPLYDGTGRIVGTLTGGSSFCTFTGGVDEYGKMSYHWESNGTVPAEQLKPWLDPDNTGALTLDGVSHAACLVSTKAIIPTDVPAFWLSPNPATDQVQVSWSSSVTTGWIQLHDASGRLLLAQSIENGRVLELGDSPKGVYVLTLVLDNAVMTRRLVKY